MSSNLKSKIVNRKFPIVRDVRLLLTAVWLGAAVFFSFALAPVLFSVLPTRELAGLVVNRMLTILNTGGAVVGVALLVSSVFELNNGVEHWQRRAWKVEVAALSVVTLASAANQWVIGRRISELRARMGRSIDEVAVNDPLRIEFGQLHGVSVAVLIVGMLAAATALLLIARRVNLKS